MDPSTADRFSFQPGAAVETRDGHLGTLDEVVTDPNSGAPRYLLVRREDGQRTRIEADAVDVAASGPDRVVLRVDRAATVVFGAGEAGTRAHYDAAERLVVPVHEEVLVPETREVDLGQVRLHKRVEELPYQGTVPVAHEEVTVERVAINRPIDKVPSPRQEGDTLVYPVVEEVLVTEKRLVLREEVRVTKRRVIEEVAIQDTLRREVVEVVDAPDLRAADRVSGAPIDPDDAAAPGRLPLS